MNDVTQRHQRTCRRVVGAAKDEIDVGMRDEPARAVEDKGLSGLAHLDARDDLFNQLEIDLREGIAGRRPVAGDRDHHEGL